MCRNRGWTHSFFGGSMDTVTGGNTCRVPRRRAASEIFYFTILLLNEWGWFHSFQMSSSRPMRFFTGSGLTNVNAYYCVGPRRRWWGGWWASGDCYNIDDPFQHWWNEKSPLYKCICRSSRVQIFIRLMYICVGLYIMTYTAWTDFNSRRNLCQLVIKIKEPWRQTLNESLPVMLIGYSKHLSARIEINISYLIPIQ